MCPEELTAAEYHVLLNYVNSSDFEWDKAAVCGMLTQEEDVLWFCTISRITIS